MSLKTMLALCLFTAACSQLPFANLFGQHPATSTTTTTTSSTTEDIQASVNGEPVPIQAAAPQAHHHGTAARGSVGKACHHNADCGDESCFVGTHHQGYCTKICDSWSDCPDDWECEHPAGLNAPQKICLQSSF